MVVDTATGSQERERQHGKGESAPAHAGTECTHAPIAGLRSVVVSRGLQALVVACILVASTAMFALAESRKLDEAPIKALVLSAGPPSAGRQQPAVFSPTCDGCRTTFARIEFRLQKPGPLQAWIVTPQGAVEQQIADFRDVRHVTLRWDGKDAKGAAAPDGSYRLKLHVAGRDRVLPVFIVVDTRPPHVTASLDRRRLVPLGWTVDDKTHVSWRSPVQLFHIEVVATDGAKRQVVPVFRHAKAGTVDWPRTVEGADGKPHRVKAAPGAWQLELVARDVAGNRAVVRLGTVQVAAAE
jgi:hypothetical protein